MPDTMIERVARAIDADDLGFSLRLVELVGGVSTYELTYSDGSGPIKFDCTDDAYEHVRKRRNEARARAALEAMREPTEVQVERGVDAAWPGPEAVYADEHDSAEAMIAAAWSAMISAAIEGV